MKLRHLLFASLIASPLAHATSFDCKKASTYVEKTICSSPLLGKLDDALSENYGAMLATDLGDGPDNKALKKEQRVWLAQRNKCTTERCLVDMYRKRVDDVCDAPVVSGVHAVCVEASDIQ
ncbi:lysozyme inhibitor LprI family protein [Paraburkholderia sp. EG287B]|uniref:lysozyme inhibitor LprI family protein n=1 Tax=Paraburkholderia sp. EG287B TaxID=3237010 RepID=UPI0034D19CB9